MTLIEDLHVHMLDLRLKRWSELLEIQQRQIEMLNDLVTRAGGMAQPTGPDESTVAGAGVGAGPLS